ncbi:MAG TPA: hypothetical protein VNB06_03225 [Thermoanaerobaculia bacterium]|nr:hypothetical protein [Thermoanaerobaculia bacterium]
MIGAGRVAADEGIGGAAEVTARLRELSRLADLRADRRLDAKLDLSPAAVTRRLRRQSALRALCLRLGTGKRRGPTPS